MSIAPESGAFVRDAGLEDSVPVPVSNRPGLPAIAYRVGTYSQFKRSMLAGLTRRARLRLQLTGTDGRALKGLAPALASIEFAFGGSGSARFAATDRAERGRVLDHPTLNGIDALEVSDEPLGTAAEGWRSVLTLSFLKPLSPELAALRAANVRFAGGARLNEIVVDSVTTSGDHVVIALERPSDTVFSGALQVRDDDDLSVALIDAWAVVGDVLTFYIERTANEHYLGTATEPRSVDALVHLVGYRRRPGLAASTWLAFGLETAPDPTAGFRPLAVPGLPTEVPVAAGTRVQSIPGPGELPQTFETVEEIVALADWNRLTPRVSAPRTPGQGDTSAWLAGVGLAVSPGDQLLFVSQERPAGSPEGWDLKRVLSVEADAAAQRTLVRWSGGLTVPATAALHVVRQRASLFGHNAPDPRLFSEEVQGNLAEALSWEGPDENQKARDWRFHENDGRSIDLDVTYRDLKPGLWVVLLGPDKKRELIAKVKEVQEAQRSDYGLSGRVTRLVLDVGDAALKAFGGQGVREASVLLADGELALAEAPLEEPVRGRTIAVPVKLAPLEAPRTIIVRGKAALAREEPKDAPVVAEVAVVERGEPQDGGTLLVLESPLANAYDRSTVEIFGNVAEATHGESVKGEVLGSGDAAKAFQNFTLRSGPLTYLRDETGEIVSTLSVWVNGVRWREATSLHGCGPRDRVYVTSTTEDGKTVVQFGDGVAGTRLPTGRDNVVADYRVGSGLAGHLDAGQLSLLMTRPLGLREVTNPIAPASAAAPQEATEARVNAPRSVVTLGRIVSLKDYEDFALDYPGIAKAAAVWTWDGSRRGVLMTVAGTAGAAVEPGGQVYDGLMSRIAAASDRRVPLVVKSYRRATFRVELTIRVDPDRKPEEVLAAVKAALAARFSFDRRRFGEVVALSDVYAAVHAVPGVVAADVDRLYRGEAAGLEPLVAADAPVDGDPPEREAAELLTLEPLSLEGVEVRP